MGDGIPNGAVGASVAVLIYSFCCLTASSLVVGLMLSYGENWTYVTLLCFFAAISTVASIIQQFHYAFAWEVIKQAQFDRALQSLTTPALGLGGAAQKVDVVLFVIQYYCYNVMSLNILFWSVALFTGSWGIRSNWLGDWNGRISTISKFFAVLFPLVIIGASYSPVIIRITVLFFIVTNITMMGSLAIGSVLLILILYKYLKTRRLLSGPARRGWWASGGSKERSRDEGIGAERTVESGATSTTKRTSYDRALVIRFTIGFVILAIFEGVIIVFSTYQPKSYQAIAESGEPNFTVSSAISDILFFIPGVTTSLVVFLVFGTTKSWREYRDFMIGGCGIKRKIYQKRIQRDVEDNSGGLEFKRLPSLPKRQSEDNAIQVEKRVRMFVSSMDSERHHPTVATVVTAQSSVHTRVPSLPPTLNLEKPRFVDMTLSVPSSPPLDANSSFEPTGLPTSVSQHVLTQHGHEEEGRRRDTNSEEIVDSRSSRSRESFSHISASTKRNTAWPAVRN